MPKLPGRDEIWAKTAALRELSHVDELDPIEMKLAPAGQQRYPKFTRPSYSGQANRGFTGHFRRSPYNPVGRFYNLQLLGPVVGTKWALGRATQLPCP